MTVNGLQINRLMKWSVQHIQQIVVGASSGVVVGDSTFASQLEIDVNSDPEQVGSLPSDHLVPLFEELVRLAEEITTKGDHP